MTLKHVKSVDTEEAKQTRAEFVRAIATRVLAEIDGMAYGKGKGRDTACFNAMMGVAIGLEAAGMKDSAEYVNRLLAISIGLRGYTALVEVAKGSTHGA